MNKFFTSCLLCAILFMAPVAVFVFQDEGVLEGERRKAVPFPDVPKKIRSQEIKQFFNEFDAFFADHFPLRSALLSFSAGLREELGDDLDRDKCVRGKEVWLFLGNSYASCVDKLQGNVAFSALTIQERTLFYKAMHDAAQRHGAQFVIFIGPNKSSIYPEYLPPTITPAPRRFVVPLADSLRAAGVDIYDATDRLLQKKKTNKLLYHRTDTHWNTLGAYEAFEGFRDHLGLPELPPAVFEPEVPQGGDLMSIGKYKKFPLKPGDSFAFRWNAPVPRAVSAKTAWIFGDSFADALKIYMQAMFAEAQFFRHEEVTARMASGDKKPDLIIFVIVERSFE